MRLSKIVKWVLLVLVVSLIPQLTDYYQEWHRIMLYNRLSPSVVIVKTDIGLGSGVVIFDGTFIVTAKHVVDEATQLNIVCEDNWIPAQVLYTDEHRDIAVLKLLGFKLKPIKKILSENFLHIGQRVYAVGNPARLEDSFYEGVIAGLNRIVVKKNNELIRGDKTFIFPEYYYGIIQLDVGPSPGFSGGGVFDSHGRLLGILTMGYLVGDVALVQPVDILLSINLKELK